MRALRLGDNVASAAGAAAVAAGVPWLLPLWRLDLSEPGSSMDAPVLAVFTGVLGAVTFAGVLAGRTRGFVAPWALLLAGYALFVRLYVVHWELGFAQLLRRGALSYALCTVLPQVAEMWAPFAAGLLLATWAARFRDGRTGFGGLLVPAALGAWAVSVAVRADESGVFSGHSLSWPPSAPRTATIALTLVAAGVVPLALAVWQLVVSWRARRSAPAAA